MLAVAQAGYRAIAPDSRGYGLSQQPPMEEWSNQSLADLEDDLLAILDTFDIPKVFLVAKDFGASPAYNLSVRYPERIKGVTVLGMPFLTKPLGFDALSEGYYLLRFMVPGRAEADFGRFDVKTVVRRIYTLFTWSELQVANKDEEILDLVDPSAPLPSWFSEQDLSIYAELYEKSGFHFALHLPYRSMFKKPSISMNSKVEVPVLLIMGEKDYVLKISGREDYIRSGEIKEYVPDLDVVFIPEGTHFVQEQFPEKINELLIDFLNKHVS